MGGVGAMVTLVLFLLLLLVIVMVVLLESGGRITSSGAGEAPRRAGSAGAGGRDECPVMCRVEEGGGPGE